VSSGVSYVPLTQPVEVVAGGLDTYALNNLEDAETTYIGKVTASGSWLLQRYNQSTGTMTYANISNNPGVASYTTAWVGRAGLVYGGFETLTGV
jgi:hypothetical protein